MGSRCYRSDTWHREGYALFCSGGEVLSWKVAFEASSTPINQSERSVRVGFDVSKLP